MYLTPHSCIHCRQERVSQFDTELTQGPEPNVDCQASSADSRVENSPSRCAVGKPLPFRMRRERQQRIRHEQQSQNEWRIRVPVDYYAASKRGCFGRTNGDFLRDSGGRVSAQLPVAEERNCDQRREFLDVHHSAHDSFRQSSAIHGCRFQ